MIEPSPFDAAVAYVVVDAHMLDDMHPYLYRTRDHGKTLTLLSGSLPQDVPLHVVREDPKKKGMLYAGTERGVVFSADDGKTWRSLQLNLPTVPVHDLIVKNDDLVVGTHGRSLWIFDDLTPIRTFGPAIAAKPIDVLPPVPATRWRYHGTVGAVARRRTIRPPERCSISGSRTSPRRSPSSRSSTPTASSSARSRRPTEPEPTAVEQEGDRRQGAGRRGAGGQGEGRSRRKSRGRHRRPG